MVRMLVNMLFEVLYYNYRINHIRMPQPGWELETVKIILTATIVAPIIGVMLH